METRPVLGIILGDHAGSSPEMAAKTVLAGTGAYTPVFIGNRERFELSRKVVEGADRLELRPLEGRPEYAGPHTVYFADVAAGPDIAFGKVTADSGRLIYDSLAKAIELEKAGVVDGLSMAPITKQALHEAGYDFSTEFEIFARLYNTPGCRAVIRGGNVFRSTVVGHCAFADIPKKLTTQGVYDTARGLLGIMRRFDAEAACKIAVAALNPHAGENGLYGNEEQEVIQPAIDRLLAEGCDVIGPCPADTVFLKALGGQVGGVVFMYHDQGNIAMKSVFFGDGVLIYIGIPANIVSVGHGPAFGKAGKGTANPKNMIASMDVLTRLVQNKYKSGGEQA